MGVTAPWPDPFEWLNNGSVGLTWSVWYLSFDKSVTFQLDAIQDSCSVRWAENTAPRASATFQIPAPSPELLGMLDPRIAGRVEIRAGYVAPDGTGTEYPLFHGIIAETSVTRPDDRLTIDAVGSEVLLQQNTAYGGVYTFPAGQSTRARIEEAAVAFGPVTANVYTEPSVPQTAAILPATIVAGDDPLQQIRQWADEIGAEFGTNMRADAGLDIFWTRRKNLYGGAVTAAFTTGLSGVAITTETTLTSNEWANAAVIRYKATPGGQEPLAWCQVEDTEFGVYRSPRRTIVDDRTDVDFPGQQPAVDASVSLLLRAFGRGKLYTIQAPIMLWVRPGDSVLVAIPDSDGRTHPVQSVTMNLGTGSMTVTTRQALSPTITGGTS